MNKTLLKNSDDFIKLINENIDTKSFRCPVVTSLQLNKDGFCPKVYPCVCVWNVNEHGDYPAELVAEFVYLSDFEYK